MSYHLGIKCAFLRQDTRRNGGWILLVNPTPEKSNTISGINDGYTAACGLQQNMPNPFDRETTIAYFLPENTRNAAISIFDISGMKVRSIPLHLTGSGYVIINGSELRAGIYMYILVADGFATEPKKMIVTD